MNGAGRRPGVRKMLEGLVIFVLLVGCLCLAGGAFMATVLIVARMRRRAASTARPVPAKTGETTTERPADAAFVTFQAQRAGALEMRKVATEMPSDPLLVSLPDGTFSAYIDMARIEMGDFTEVKAFCRAVWRVRESTPRARSIQELIARSGQRAES
jgi:hypothetical protein